MKRTWEDIVGLVPEPGTAPDWRMVCEVFPEILALSQVPQDPRHHAEGDVYIHTQLCTAELLADPAWGKLPREEQLVLFLATLLHDLGKGFKTAEDDDGSIRAPHHARAGAIEARGLLWKADTPVPMRERICNLIALHQVLFHALEEGGPDLDWLLRRASLKAPISHLLMLGRADTKGRLPKQPASLECLELLEIRAEELGCLHGPAIFPDAICRLRYLEARGTRSPDVPTYGNDGSQVTLLSGLPASGKDTWVNKHWDTPSVSFDDARAELGLKHGENDGQATQRALANARMHLRKQVPFIWNATFLSREMRQRPAKLVADYYGELHAVCLECPPQELYRRNQARKAHVPEAAIEQMLRRWEPPCLDEVCSITFVMMDGTAVDGKTLLVATAD